MESYYLEFGNHRAVNFKNSKHIKTHRSSYEKEYLPLALEFYSHHIQSSDLVLLNSLLSFHKMSIFSTNNESGISDSANNKKGDTNLIYRYFPNIDSKLQHNLSYNVNDRLEYYE